MTETMPRLKPACDHEMKSTTVGAMGTNFDVSWCRHCGAFRVRGSKWELPVEGIGQRVAMLESNVEYYKGKLEAALATIEGTNAPATGRYKVEQDAEREVVAAASTMVGVFELCKKTGKSPLKDGEALLDNYYLNRLATAAHAHGAVVTKLVEEGTAVKKAAIAAATGENNATTTKP